jgi:hypothetical protein
MPSFKFPSHVSTVWFEANGATRHAACRVERVGKDRVRLHNLQYGGIQADLSVRLFRGLVANGCIRPLDEVPTLPANRRPDGKP